MAMRGITIMADPSWLHISPKLFVTPSKLKIILYTKSVHKVLIRGVCKTLRGKKWKAALQNTILMGGALNPYILDPPPSPPLACIERDRRIKREVNSKKPFIIKF